LDKLKPTEWSGTKWNGTEWSRIKIPFYCLDTLWWNGTNFPFHCLKIDETERVINFHFQFLPYLKKTSNWILYSIQSFVSSTNTCTCSFIRIFFNSLHWREPPYTKLLKKKYSTWAISITLKSTPCLLQAIIEICYKQNFIGKGIKLALTTHNSGFIN